MGLQYFLKTRADAYGLSMSQSKVPRQINRIIVLSLDGLYSGIALPLLVEHLQGRIVCICKSRRFGGKYGSYWGQIKKNYKRSGFRFIVYMGLQLFLFYPMSSIADRINRWRGSHKCVYPLRELARLHNIPLISTYDLNRNEFVDRLRVLKPDLIISFYFDHVLRQPMIELPSFGIINIHTGILPDIKGPFPNIWAVINGCNRVGATVHYIDTETLDTGPIIKVRQVDRDPEESTLALDCRLARLAAGLAVEAIAEIENGTAKALAQDKNAGGYFSYPTRDDLRRFRRQGGRLYRIRDFVRQFFVRENQPST